MTAAPGSNVTARNTATSPRETATVIPASDNHPRSSNGKPANAPLAGRIIH